MYKDFFWFFFEFFWFFGFFLIFDFFLNFLDFSDFLNFFWFFGFFSEFFGFFWFFEFFLIFWDFFWFFFEWKTPRFKCLNSRKLATLADWWVHSVANFRQLKIRDATSESRTRTCHLPLPSNGVRLIGFHADRTHTATHTGYTPNTRCVVGLEH